MHNHSWYSECWGVDLDKFYDFAKNISCLDYTAVSDHIYKKPLQDEKLRNTRLFRYRFGRDIPGIEAWRDIVEKANNYNKENDFVTLIGYEWSSMDSGHYNIYLKEHYFENMDKIFTDKFIPYAFVMRQMLKKTDALFIPHIQSRTFPYLSLIQENNDEGEPMTPVIEVYSDWGESIHPYHPTADQESLTGCLREKCRSYLEALEIGIDPGLVCDSDTHTGLTGRTHPGSCAPDHDHPQGLTAVRADELTRDGIFDAYRNKLTYGTTGERIYLEVKINNDIPGEIYYSDESLKIYVTAAGTDNLESISLYEGTRLVETKFMGAKKDVTVKFIYPAPAEYKKPLLVEVVQKNGHKAWCSPVWIKKKSLPQLVWKKEREKIFVKNQGNANAYNVPVWYFTGQHPVTAESIKPVIPAAKKDAVFIWTDRISDDEVIFHFRWQGPPLKGEVQIKGSHGFEYDVNGFFAWFGEQIEKKIDKLKFDIRHKKVGGISIGFNVKVKNDPEKISQAVFKFDKHVSINIGDKTVKSDTFALKLNGRKDTAVPEIIKIKKLSVGQMKEIEYKQGYFAIDPQNKIFKLRSGDKLLIV